MSIQMYPSNYHEIEDVREPVEFFDSNDYMVESGYFRDAEGWYRVAPGFPTNDFPRALIHNLEEFFEYKLHDEDGGGYVFDGSALQLRQFIKYLKADGVSPHLWNSLAILSESLDKHKSEGFCLRG